MECHLPLKVCPGLHSLIQVSCTHNLIWLPPLKGTVPLTLKLQAPPSIGDNCIHSLLRQKYFFLYHRISSGWPKQDYMQCCQGTCIRCMGLMPLSLRQRDRCATH